MLDPTKREGFSRADAKFLEIIDRYGWHVMSVAPRADSQDKQEWFSYSTGLFMRFGHPEIILCGLDADIAIRIINAIGNAVKSGRKFDLDTDYRDIFANDVKCCFRAVHLSQYSDYVCWTQWFYERDVFPVWQCFWPDKAGNYPWESACHPEVAELQPCLDRPSPQVM
jgi:hypothetical protein